jgi:serine/threonine kinase 16
LQDCAAEQCTAPYRAPELFLVPSSAIIDEKTDIWSLGCVLYALVYSMPPFDGSATATIGGKIFYPESVACLTFVKDLIDFMLVKDPKYRPDIDQVMTRAQSNAWE